MTDDVIEIINQGADISVREWFRKIPCTPTAKRGYNQYDNYSDKGFLLGDRHRSDGPAVIWSDGREEWWENGARQHREGQQS